MFKKRGEQSELKRKLEMAWITFIFPALVVGLLVLMWVVAFRHTTPDTDGAGGDSGTGSVNTEDMIGSEWAEESENDVRYESITAFLQKDIKTLRSLIWDANTRDVPVEEMLEELESIVIGKYSVEEISDLYALRFCFEITDSDCSYFPVGQYEYNVSYGGPAGAVYWSDAAEEYSELDSLPNMLALRYIEYAFAYTDDPGNDICKEAVFFDILTLHAREYEEFTIPEEYMRKAAYEIFGLTDYVPPETLASLGDEGYSSLVYGGLNMKCDLIHVETKEDSLSFEYQLYADACGFVRSHIVEVTLNVSDNEWGYSFSSVKIIQPGKYVPFSYYV